MSKDAVDRLHEAARNEQTVVALNRLCNEQADTIESLRAQLAEVTREREGLIRAVANHVTVRGEYYQQLLAAQAHAARLVEALAVCEPLAAYGRPGTRDVEQANFQVAIKAALSTPINLDALHEDRARTLEEAATVVGLSSEVAERAIQVMAAAHRARKEPAK